MPDIAKLSSVAGWWSWVDQIAVALVFFAVVVEGISEWLPRERRDSSLWTSVTRTGWLLLVAALATEYVAQRNRDGTDMTIIADLNDQGKALRNTNLVLRMRVADAQRESAAAKAEQERLKAQVVWRNLNAARCALLADDVRNDPGVVEIEYPIGDPEALNLAIHLENCLHVAGWNVTTTAAAFANVLPKNIILTGPDKIRTEEVAEGLRAARLSVGTAGPQALEILDRNTIEKFGADLNAPVRIIVGSRPIGAP